MTTFFGFVVAAFVTMVLIPPIVRGTQSLRVLDLPDDRKVHTSPTPRLGGLAIAIGASLPILMWATFDRVVVAYLAGVVIILVFGIWDDLRAIDYRLKLVGQLIAVSAVVGYGGVVVSTLPFGGLDSLPTYLAGPLTLVALVGVTNAVNLADGLDGLAGGLVLLSLGTMTVLAYTAQSDPTLMLIAVSVLGSVLGFLRFNTYPARIFMGDCGSQFLGFSVGVLAVLLTQHANTALSPALPLLILGLPILDTLLVMAERIAEGRSPFAPDRKHIHHKLLALGFHHYESVFVLYLLQAALVIAAYLMRFESDAAIVGTYAAFCVAVVGLLRIASARNWRTHASRHRRSARDAPAWVSWLAARQRIPRIASYVALGAMTAFLLVAAFNVDAVPMNVSIAACVVLVLLPLFHLRRTGQQATVVGRTSAYLAAICVVYLMQIAPGGIAGFDLYRNVLFCAIGLAVIVGFRFSKERFQVTPLDFLIIFIAVVVPNLPDLDIQTGHIASGIVMLIILFYGIELVLNSSMSEHASAIQVTTYVTFAVLGARGLAAVLQ